MSELIYVPVFICIVFGVCSAASGFDIFGRQRVKNLTCGVIAFCLAFTLIVVAGV